MSKPEGIWPEDNKLTPEWVSGAFDDFLYMYEEFRKQNGLSGKIDNVYEIMTAMTDKLGRMCRQVKHQKRNDPKPDWPEGLTTEMSGLIFYMILLKNHYGVDIMKGMEEELQKAVDQHGVKDKTEEGV